MANSHTKKVQGGGAGRIGLWVALALTVALLGFVTLTAVRHNPLYSDRDAYGISKYKFLNACKEELLHPEKLPVSLGGQGQTTGLGELLTQAQQLQRGERPGVQVLSTPAQTVSSVQSIPAEGNAPRRWGLSVPALLVAERAATGTAGTNTRPLAQATVQCLYDRSQPQEQRLQVGLSLGS